MTIKNKHIILNYSEVFSFQLNNDLTPLDLSIFIAHFDYFLYYNKVLEWCGLLWRVRARRSRPAIRSDAVKLQGMVLRVRSTSCGRGHGLVGGPRIQPDTVQHETRHSPERGPDHIPKRHETNTRPDHRALPHTSEHEGLGRAGHGVGILASEPRWWVRRGNHVIGWSSSPAELAGCRDAGASQAYSFRYCFMMFVFAFVISFVLIWSITIVALRWFNIWSLFSQETPAVAGVWPIYTWALRA